ncbi:hypothetical protein DVA78_19735, partial [Acinetobacter baumannii]
MKWLVSSEGWTDLPQEMKTLFAKVEPGEKSKPKVDPLEEPIGDGYSRLDRSPPEKMSGEDRE